MTKIDHLLLLRRIRDETRMLLAEIEPSIAPTRPLRIEASTNGPLRIWSDLDSLTVFTLNDGGPAVYVMAGARVPWRPGTVMQWYPDWCALSVDEARTLGLALLGAATDGAE